MMVNGDEEAPYPESSNRVVERRRFAESRCCFERFSSKIGAYLFTSFFAHEIAIAMIYTLKRDDWSSTNHIPLLTIRCCQLITVAIAYFGLWKHKHYFLIPFIVAQLTLGSYADLSTWMILVKDQSSKTKVPPFFFSTPLFYLVLPILVYAALCVFFTYVMYKCFAFFKARYAANTRLNEIQELTEMETF